MWSLGQPLGGFPAPVAEVTPVVCWIEISSLLGDVKIATGPIPTAKISIPDLLGQIQIVTVAEGDEWGAAGLPCPLLNGYQYGNDPGIVRTLMRSGRYRQRRLYTTGFRPASMSVIVDRSLLNTLESFISSRQYRWFRVRLITADNTDATPEAHAVRIVDNVRYSAVGLQVKADMEIEIR